MDKPSDFQKLTEDIAREGGLSVDLRTSTDPTFIIQKEGEFWRKLRQKVILTIRNPFIIVAISLLITLIAVFTIRFTY